MTAKLLARARCVGIVAKEGDSDRYPLQTKQKVNLLFTHMSLQSTITQTDGTVRSTTWVGLLYQLVMLAYTLQGRYNRAKPKFKKSGITIDKKFDGETASLVATISLEGQRIIPANGTKPEFVLDSTLSDYIVDANNAPVPFDGGTGVLAGVTSVEQALADIAEMVSFLESQIEPDQLLKEINIVNLTPAPEDGNAALSITIPLRVVFDIATGKSDIVPKNYLYILDVDPEAI